MLYKIINVILFHDNLKSLPIIIHILVNYLIISDIKNKALYKLQNALKLFFSKASPNNQFPNSPTTNLKTFT